MSVVNVLVSGVAPTPARTAREVVRDLSRRATGDAADAGSRRQRFRRWVKIHIAAMAAIGMSAYADSVRWAAAITQRIYPVGLDTMQAWVTRS